MGSGSNISPGGGARQQPEQQEQPKHMSDRCSNTIKNTTITNNNKDIRKQNTDRPQEQLYRRARETAAGEAAAGGETRAGVAATAAAAWVTRDADPL